MGLIGYAVKEQVKIIEPMNKRQLLFSQIFRHLFRNEEVGVVEGDENGSGDNLKCKGACGQSYSQVISYFLNFMQILVFVLKMHILPH